MPSKYTPNTHPTGMARFDTLLGGGIPDMSIVVVHGSSASGSRTLVQQILYNRAVSGGKIGYLTVERSSKDVEEDMAVHGWTLEPLVQDGRWVFGDLYSLRHRGTQTKPGSQMPTQQAFSVLDRLHSDALKMMAEGRWIILDSLSSVYFMHDLKDIAYFIEVLTMATRVYGGIHFVVSISGIYDLDALPILTNLVDGVIEFKLDEAPSQRMVPDGVLRVTKMRRLPPAIRNLGYTISADGFSV
ncbi:MAG: hypothetical protein HYU39_09435 [Thaumarchaeota archaeon]|nr:hypothetical protein [Nitrososphaerota archaeon]